jgi:heme/copper-type cytochrome/quinol oxidase subunit 2
MQTTYAGQSPSGEHTFSPAAAGSVVNVRHLSWSAQVAIDAAWTAVGAAERTAKRAMENFIAAVVVFVVVVVVVVVVWLLCFGTRLASFMKRRGERKRGLGPAANPNCSSQEGLLTLKPLRSY